MKVKSHLAAAIFVCLAMPHMRMPTSCALVLSFHETTYSTTVCGHGYVYAFSVCALCVCALCVCVCALCVHVCYMHACVM